jgi:signal transduction histidine kinase
MGSEHGMSGRIWLDWAVLAVSHFNTILALWLALTVLLNAGRRDAGVWLMGGGLLVGAAFWVSHSAILGQGLTVDLATLNLWWRAGWFPVMLAPFAWYGVVLWYGGFWSEHPSSLAQRHRVWLWLVSLWLVGLIGLMLVANPIPAFDQVAPVSSAFTVRNLPALFLLFPLWMVTCILLSADALLRPAQTSDPNTTRARQRAQPWLVGTAGALLAVSLVVIAFIGRVLVWTRNGSSPLIDTTTVAAYDLAVSLLIALALLLVGQAVVAYEVFTGRVLPRRSLVRHWRTAILLAAGFAAVAAGILIAQLRPVYSLLLATLLITIFYALYSWRALREREQWMARLRPFVQSQGSTASATGTSPTADYLLAALCREVLDTPHAQLIPLGSIATLAGSGLTYPPASEVRDFRPPCCLPAGMTPLDPGEFAPYRWAVALWGEWGLSGALLVGEKRDGGLYSQEEMEIAQATGERILQFLTNEQMLQRLMELQRTRTVEQRVMDLHTRRTLHDEILPALHLAILQLHRASPSPPVDETLESLTETHRQIAALLVQTQPAPGRAPDPSDLLASLQTLVHPEFARHFAEVRWHANAAPMGAAGEAIYVDALTEEVIVGAAREVIRNAALHGRGGRRDFPLQLDITLGQDAGKLTLVIEDNGVGINAGRGSASAGGSGSGLALHSTLLAMVGGYLTVEARDSGGTAVTITVKEPHR